MRLTRRTALKGASALLGASAFPLGAFGSEGLRHALTVFGDPKHGADFAHFDYVNPAAPKGGAMSLTASSWATNGNPQSFDTFNMFILRGNSPPLMPICYAALMARGLDEPDTVYPYLAEGVEVSGLRYAFAIRPGATFSDGSPITSHDVVFTLNALKEDGHPALRQPLTGVEKVEAADEATAVITFAEGTSNRLPPLIAVYPIISRADIEAREFTAANLDRPVTSGPYVVGEYRLGRWVEFTLRDDWWGTDVPSQVGHNNFGRIRMNFFRERTLAFEAFKAGEVTFREEFTSKTWATEYDFPAVREGKVILREFPDDRPAGAQGWFFNTRRQKFADPRTREALGYAFDFEFTNRQFFFDSYKRVPSYFVNSDLMATGEPTEAELALLEPYRDQLPPEVFGEAWLPPVTDGTGDDREGLRRANELLMEAGWRRVDGKLVDANGVPLTVEFIYPSPTFSRILQPLQARLRRIGVEATLRQVDPAQFQDRLNNFDFDVAGRRFALTATPGEGIREIFTSQAAQNPGSSNLAGIASPVVDDLVERVIAAPTREEMLTAAHALDRVLRAGHYWIPNWYKGSHTVAYWDIFGIPDEKPRYDFPFASTWWSKEA